MLAFGTRNNVTYGHSSHHATVSIYKDFETTANKKLLFATKVSWNLVEFSVRRTYTKPIIAQEPIGCTLRKKGSYVSNIKGIIRFGVGSEHTMILAVSSVTLCLVLELEMLCAHFKRLIALIIDCFMRFLVLLQFRNTDFSCFANYLHCSNPH